MGTYVLLGVMILLPFALIGSLEGLEAVAWPRSFMVNGFLNFGTWAAGVEALAPDMLGSMSLELVAEGDDLGSLNVGRVGLDVPVVLVVGSDGDRSAILGVRNDRVDDIPPGGRIELFDEKGLAVCESGVLGEEDPSILLLLLDISSGRPTS